VADYRGLEGAVRNWAAAEPFVHLVSHSPICPYEAPRRTAIGTSLIAFNFASY
jgi:hypothetical protein